MSKHNWTELAGMSESTAEDYMLSHWNKIPEQWNDPLFRDQVLGIQGQAELSAHMNFGEQAYGRDSRLGPDATGVWDLRNIAGQGHPAETAWRDKQRRK